MNAVALVVALASFVISVAALYATAFMRAQIGIHQATVERPWHFGGWNGLTPSGEGYVTLALYAHNAGANAGILEAVQIAPDSTLEGVLAQPVTWYPVKTKPDMHPSHAQAQLPQGIDAGEIEELFFVGRFLPSLTPIQRLHDDVEDDMKREEAFARKLHETESLSVTVMWRYARPAGLIRNRQPTTRTGTMTALIPAAPLRDAAIEARENQDALPGQPYGDRPGRLVAIARTGRPPVEQREGDQRRPKAALTKQLRSLGVEVPAAVKRPAIEPSKANLAALQAKREQATSAGKKAALTLAIKRMSQALGE